MSKPCGGSDPTSAGAVPEAVLKAWGGLPGISWLGPREDVREVWREAHVAVVPSLGREGMPRAMLEAAACARPLVVSAVSGCQYFVRDGVEGLIVQPGDAVALADALERKQLAGAGLDVWATEPPPCDHPLLKFDNVLVSPHTAGVTREARINMGKIAAEQILDALDGKRPPRIINPEVWPVYAKRFEKAFGFAPG